MRCWERCISEPKSPAYGSKLAKAYGRGCLRSCVTMIGGLVLGITLVGTTLWLIQGGRADPASPRFTLALALPILLMLAVFALVAIFVLARSRRLDREFEPLGLDGEAAGPVIRGWHGEFSGRRLDIWFHKGPTLEIYLGCNPATRGGILQGGRFVETVNRTVGKREPLSPSPLELPGVAVFADDEDWMRSLLTGSGLESALGELLAESGRTWSGVFVAPDAVRYVRRFVPQAEITTENVRFWLERLEVLARAVDSRGPSEQGLEPTKMETWARERRGSGLNKILAFLGLFWLLTMGGLFLWMLVHFRSMGQG